MLKVKNGRTCVRCLHMRSNISKKKMNEEQLYLNFDEYRKVCEPHKREYVEAWRVAFVVFP